MPAGMYKIQKKKGEKTMASSVDYINSGYSSYRDYLDGTKYGSTDKTDSTDAASSTNKTQNWNMVVDEDGKGNTLDVDGFMKIMVAQLTNQDFMNPVDDTQFVTQMAQFSMMQQMSDMTSNMKNNYMLSLVGQTVTCAKFNVSGNVVKETGKVERIVLAENDYSIYVNGEKFSLSQIMELGGAETENKTDTNTDTGTDTDENTDSDQTGTEGTTETETA